MSIFINRMMSDNIQDTNVQNQGGAFLCLGVVPEILYIPPTITTPGGYIKNPNFTAISNALNNNTLLFLEDGSLFDSSNPDNPLFLSPLYKSNTVPNDTNLVTLNDANSIYVNSIEDINNNTYYLSPVSGKAILKSTNSNITYQGQQTSNGQYEIFYNPVNRTDPSNLTANVLSEYCQLVNNADPICYCQSGTSPCGNSVVNQQLSKLSTDDATAVSNNCVYLNPMCQSWATNNKYVQNELNTIEKSIPLRGGVKICGNEFKNSGGIITNLTNPTKDILTACNLSSIPQKPIITSPTPTNVPTPTPTPTASKTMTNILIFVIIFVIFLGIAYLI